MKKSVKPVNPSHNGKGFLALAGEAFSVLGEEIVEGKDKVVEVASEKFTAVKKAIKNITHKKGAPVRNAKKKVVVVKNKAVVVARGAKKKATAVKKAAKKAVPARKKAR